MAATSRASGALSLEEERHALLGKAHCALAAQFRLDSVEEQKEGVSEASTSLDCTKQELLVSLDAASTEVLADKATMLLVLRASGQALARCSQELRDDPEIILAANQENRQRSEPSLQACTGVTGRACGALNLEEEKHALLAKARLALGARCRLNSVEEGEEPIHDANANLQKLQSELAQALSCASGDALADRALMLIVLSAYGRALHRCSPGFRHDPEMVLAACHENGYMLQLASAELRADRDFVLRAVSLDGFALGGACPELQNDREVVMAALRCQPLAFREASDQLRGDRDLVLAALRQQSRRNFFVEGGAVWSAVLDDPESDRELLLEAARVDGEALARATLELRQDKDFILEVMRRAPDEDQEICYDQADEAARNATAFEDFQGARDSVLASAGEDAPVLTVTVSLPPFPAPEGNSRRASHVAVIFDVSLLSGAGFTCKLRGHRARKRRRTGPRNPPMTLSQLADLMRTELLAHMQVDPPPARIFIVLRKQDAEGEDISVPVTPWDWNRAVTDFC